MVGRYQPRHVRLGLGGARARHRRPLVVAGVAGATAVVATAVLLAMTSTGDGHGDGPEQASPPASAAGGLRLANSSSAGSPAISGPGRYGGASAGATGPSTGIGAVYRGTPAPGRTTSTTANRDEAHSPAVNMAAPDGFGPLISKVWVHARPGGAPLSAADVQSILPGSVFYAEQPAIVTYWAISRFVPSPLAESRSSTSAGKAVLAQFNDFAVFDKVPGRAWAYKGTFDPPACSVALPAPVLAVWGMCPARS
jgi:hypothetical protein